VRKFAQKNQLEEEKRFLLFSSFLWSIILKNIVIFFLLKGDKIRDIPDIRQNPILCGNIR